MKTLELLILFMLYRNAFSRESDYEGHRHEDPSSNFKKNFSNNLMRPQRFTAGTLLGLLVASVVVVIGSFLVLWRLCCDVEMVVNREALMPLQSISQSVTSKRKSTSQQQLISQSCSSNQQDVA
ncbi:hypothetical protein X975_26446, partial [Stegodyphus mimosarum]